MGPSIERVLLFIDRGKMWYVKVMTTSEKQTSGFDQFFSRLSRRPGTRSDALAAPVEAEEAGQIVDRELAHLCRFRRSFESALEDPNVPARR